MFFKVVADVSGIKSKFRTAKGEVYLTSLDMVFRVMQNRAELAVAYLEQNREMYSGKEVKNYNELIAQVKAIPNKIIVEYTTGLYSMTHQYFTEDFIKFYFDLLSQHDFCNPNLTVGDSSVTSVVDNILKKVTGFENEVLRHIPGVNAQNTYLEKMTQGISKLLIDERKAPTTGKGLHSIFNVSIERPAVETNNYRNFTLLNSLFSLVSRDFFQAMLQLHDLGKINPPQTNGLNNYGAHPYVGEKALNGFLDSGKSVIDYSVIGGDLFAMYGITEEDTNAMLSGLQIGHLLLAGPALGENSTLTALDTLKNPRLQGILSDPSKRIFYLRLLAMVTVSDISGYGFLSKEKVEYFVNTVDQLDSVAQNMNKAGFEAMNTRGSVFFSALDPYAVISTINKSNPNAVREEFWRRFEGVLTANTKPNSPQRELGYIRSLFIKFVEEHVSDLDVSNSEQVFQEFEEFFTKGLCLEYFRNFFQGIMLSKDGATLQNKDIVWFDLEGLKFMLKLIHETKNSYQPMYDKLVMEGRHRFGDAYTSNVGMFIQRTGTTNSQVDYSNPINFLQNVASNPELIQRFFSEIDENNNKKWVRAEFEQRLGVIRIHYDFDGYMAQLRSEGKLK